MLRVLAVLAFAFSLVCAPQGGRLMRSAAADEVEASDDSAGTAESKDDKGSGKDDKGSGKGGKKETCADHPGQCHEPAKKEKKENPTCAPNHNTPDGKVPSK